MFDPAHLHHSHLDVVQERGTSGHGIALVLHERTPDCSGRVSETTEQTKKQDEN